MNTEKEPFDPLDEPPYKIGQESCYIKPDPYSNSNTINRFSFSKPKWSVEFIPNSFIYTQKDCNWFHRLMQRLILGFKWNQN